jgi:hypothetical protein
VLSGFAIENYSSGYWKSRGHPRFYRYLVDSAHRNRMLTYVNAAQSVPDSNRKSGPLARPVANHQVTDLTDDTDDIHARNTGNKFASSNSEILDPVLVSRHPKPSKEEVRAAIISGIDVNGERLLRSTAVDSEPNIAVADDFNVLAIHTHDHSGWAEVEVKEMASIQFGKPELNPVTRMWRVNLRREQRDWVLLPSEHVYLRRDLAIRVLANHLASISRARANHQEFKKTMNVLDKLMAEATASALPLSSP